MSVFEKCLLFVKGKTASLLSEIIYENRLKPFTLSVGLAYTYKHTMNNYQGSHTIS